MPSVRRRLLIKPLELNRAKQMVPTSTMDTKCGRNISVWQVFLKNLALISASMMAKAIRSAVPMTMKMMLYRSVFAVNVHAAPEEKRNLKLFSPTKRLPNRPLRTL